MKNTPQKIRDRFLLTWTIIFGIAFVTGLVLLLADSVRADESTPQHTDVFVTTDTVTNFPWSLLPEDKK